MILTFKRKKIPDFSRSRPPHLGPWSHFSPHNDAPAGNHHIILTGVAGARTGHFVTGHRFDLVGNFAREFVFLDFVDWLLQTTTFLQCHHFLVLKPFKHYIFLHEGRNN